MSSFIPANLPAGLVEPGIYASLVMGSDPGLSRPGNRALLFGFMSSGYPGVPDEPKTFVSLDEVRATFGPKSMIAHRFATAKKRIPVGFEAVLVPLLEPSSGTASAVTFEITGEPVAGVLSSATAAPSYDTVRVTLRGRGVSVGIRKDEDWATIATNIKTAWDELLDAPATMTRASAALTLTAPHKGAFDNGALEITFASNGASGIAAKLGTVTVTGVAGGAGTVKVTMGKHVSTADIAAAATAAIAGTAILSKVNSTSNPVRLAQPSSATGTLTIFAVNGRPVRPLKISTLATGIAPQTVTTATGTAGAGNPSLTQALANIEALDEGFRVWAPFWYTTSEVSAVAASVELQALPPVQKGQCAVFATTASLAELGATNLATATTPRLDSSYRFPLLWAQCAPNADWELSAQLAASIAAEEDAGRNWNGFTFVGDSDAPIVPTHSSDRPNRDERNTAIAVYRHSPVTVNSAGLMTLTFGGNSYKPKGFKDEKYRKISAQQTVDYMRGDLVTYLDSLFGSGSPTGAKRIKTSSDPRTAFVTTVEEVRTYVYRWMKRLDDADLFDGAEANKDALQAAILVSPNRIDVNVPFVPLADLDIIAPVGVTG